jgi:hypothetical protein
LCLHSEGKRKMRDCHGNLNRELITFFFFLFKF